MDSLCHYRSYGSKRLEKYLLAVENGTVDEYYNNRGHLGLSQSLLLVKEYLYNKYLSRGYNFCFRTSVIKRDIGIDASVIGRSLMLMCSEDYKDKPFAVVLHRTRGNKRTVWKTCFGVDAK